MDIPQNLRELAGWGAVPVVILFLQYYVKPTFPALDKRWLPSIAVGMALAWCVFLAVILSLPILPEVAKGIVAGLLAVGTFSAVRATAGQ